MSTFSMSIVKGILSKNNIEDIKDSLGFIVTVLRDNDICVSVFAGIEYTGLITDVDENGFWITEDKQKEEYVSFADFERLSLLS